MPTTYFEHDIADVDRSVTNGIRAALGVSGLLSLFIGVLIMAWPAKTAMVVAGIIAVYAGLAGLVNLAIGVFSRRLGAWPRIAYLALGVLFVVSAVVAFANLGAAAAGLGVLLGVIIGIVWVVEGVVGLTMIGDSSSKVWTLLYAAISIVAGITLITSPLWGATLLWVLLGLSLVVMGVVQVVRALRFGPR